MQIAADESYRDSSNLQAKTQKHQAFEAELAANKRRLDAVNIVSFYLLLMPQYQNIFYELDEHFILILYIISIILVFFFFFLFWY